MSHLQRTGTVATNRLGNSTGKWGDILTASTQAVRRIIFELLHQNCITLRKKNTATSVTVIGDVRNSSAANRFFGRVVMPCFGRRYLDHDDYPMLTLLCTALYTSSFFYMCIRQTSLGVNESLFFALTGAEWRTRKACFEAFATSTSLSFTSALNEWLACSWYLWYRCPQWNIVLIGLRFFPPPFVWWWKTWIWLQTLAPDVASLIHRS
jgi:hypothetical protein